MQAGWAFLLLLLSLNIAVGDVWKFVFVADVQSGISPSNAVNTNVCVHMARQIVRESPDLFLLPGDLVYGNTNVDVPAMLAEYAQWSNAFSAVYAAGIPIYPVRGNHEPTGDDTNATAYLTVFGAAVPNNGPAGEVGLTYSFVHNNALFIGLDQYKNPHQVNQPWLDSQLASNRCAHIFVFGHEPAVQTDAPTCLALENAQRDLFLKSITDAGCRMYLCGHDHLYNRGRLFPRSGGSIMQVLCGSGGAPFSTWSGIYGQYFHEQAMGSNCYYSAFTNGYVLITVSNFNVKMEWKASTDLETWTTYDTYSSEATDYSVASHWMTVPAATNKAVDVFYLYPTAWTSTNPNPEICAIDNPSMLAKAPESSALQVTAFEPIANIYAPFYRQDNLSPIDRLEIIAGIPTLDAVAAFDYYINNFNHGRPFMLAGHSQGSDVLSNLLAEYMQTHPAVLARMIAAYVIGFPITAEYLADNPHLKFAEGPGDTGVIVSYNTEAPDVVPPVTNPVLSGLIGVVINPITWTRSETLATTEQGMGSFMPNSSGVFTRVAQYADARIDTTRGVLICASADEDAIAAIQPQLPRGVYHNFDYPFYYYNIRSNAANRIQNFLHKVGSDYDADGKTDPVVYDAPSGVFGVFLSGSSYALSTVSMGIRSTAYSPGQSASAEPGSLQPVPGDFDGDCLADPAVYLPAVPSAQPMQAGDPIAARLLVRFSSQAYSLNTMPIGDATCVPVAGDFDGDRKSDPALYSAALSQMAAWQSGAAYAAAVASLGGAGWLNAGDDYDGDGKTDPAVFEMASGVWQVLMSANAYAPATLATASGAGVMPAPGDYDGDGRADLALFQPATGWWLIALSGQGYAQTLFQGFASSTFLARPGDYDGDGKTDPAVYAPGLNAYCVWQSGSGYNPAILSW